MDSSSFYNFYTGHSLTHLQILYKSIKKLAPQSKIVYLAGDSSLDNKFWILNERTKKAINYYQLILNPPEMKPDICYHLNYLLRGSPYICINCAVEESTLVERTQGNLLEQDVFIQQHLKKQDVLIVSVGGNDIVYKPTFTTLYNLVLLISLNTIENLKKTPLKCWGFRHFIYLFKNQVTQYIKDLISQQKPKLVIVCMFYYPDEYLTYGWADDALSYLGYNRNPEKLQVVIQQIYKYAIQQISIPNVQIVACPMFDILDCKSTQDYVERVEPSNMGGRKIAKSLVELIFNHLQN
jgi:hypothetical protein